ncbi:DUF551 domain-containing protein [Enterobacter asburiae]|uniref:DUF551 domain-containing protein n=1 Tax=Enterobacter asburiae TaxID=61645 RepID=UPI001651BFF7|nr:DUF551 domain-containing protein [Enterobacter asburiae]
MSTIAREQLIEELKASTQNSSGMFEIGEETICSLMSLLTAPPAPTSVPAAYEHTEDFSEYHEGWNACRAAMLQGAEPVMTANKLRAGWVAVHDEMPPQYEPLLICTRDGVVQRTVYGFDGENWLDWYEQYDPISADRCDLWQPLPAAPQQEAE